MMLSQCQKIREGKKEEEGKQLFWEGEGDICL